LDNFTENTTFSSRPLGILPNSRPTTDDGASRRSLKLTYDAEGVVQVPADRSENRLKRYIRQSAARRLLPKNRVSWCLRRPNKDAQGVSVHKSAVYGTAHFGDLITCSRIWECPVCAAKISERRRNELSKIVQAHKAAGGTVLLITLTYSHHREDILNHLLIKQSKALVYFYSHRDYKNLKSKYSKIGRVRALEVNHGQSNGWHPHIHELWFMNGQIDGYHDLKLEIYQLWRKACLRFDLGEPSLKHGVDVRGGEYAAKYASKWGIEDEITKAHIKSGRSGSRSPFQLLDSYIDDDKQAGALFVEYTNAFKGSRQLKWSKGLKNLYDISEISDEELAATQEESAELMGMIDLEQWKKILANNRGRRSDNRSIILTLAENGGWGAVQIFIEGVCNESTS